MLTCLASFKALWWHVSTLLLDVQCIGQYGSLACHVLGCGALSTDAFVLSEVGRHLLSSRRDHLTLNLWLRLCYTYTSTPQLEHGRLPGWCSTHSLIDALVFASVCWSYFRIRLISSAM